jgi:hypothetical protein
MMLVGIELPIGVITRRNSGQDQGIDRESQGTGKADSQFMLDWSTITSPQ